ncbi:MAG: hypothetical protein AB1758_09440, partial [Candidatus Eremiobacterota bacterium]
PHWRAFGGVGNVLVVNQAEPPAPQEEVTLRATALTADYQLERYARQTLPDRHWDGAAPVLRDRR